MIATRKESKWVEWVNGQLVQDEDYRSFSGEYGVAYTCINAVTVGLG